MTITHNQSPSWCKSAWQTEAAVLCELGQPLRLMTLTLPPLQPGQVLVEVAYSGVCRSQLLEMHGKRGPDPFLPHTLGHEGAGTVIRVGPGVTKVTSGERVVLSWIKGTGADVAATRYQSHMGGVNSGAISTFMSYTITCENRLTPLPASMPLREAALLGCAVLTGMGMVVNTAQIAAGSSVAVFGVGGIGLNAVWAAALRQATPIIAVDIVDEKLAQARRLGATHVINSRSHDPCATIQQITDQRGVDYAIEAAGQRVTMEQAFQAVRYNGGLCILAGNVPHGERLLLDPFDLIKGKRIVGSWGGESQPDRDIPRYIALYETGELPLASLITHVYAFHDIHRALDDLEQGKVGRALLDMTALHTDMHHEHSEC